MDEIIKFKKKMNNIIRLSIAKTVFSSFNIFLFFIMTSCFIKGEQGVKNVTAVISIGLLLVHFIIVIICLSFNIIYVQKVMNRINNDFERKGNNYSWILFTFFLDIIFALYSIMVPVII